MEDPSTQLQVIQDGTDLSQYLPGESVNVPIKIGKKKIAAADVASVGNASDTMVNQFSGRELHEAAKLALNRHEYRKALDMFEAILTAQIQRFGPCHPSVAAAMHNVGGTFEPVP